MSPIMPAQPTPILSVILKTFFATLLITKVPYEYLRSDARIAPSLQTSPTVVAPGMKPSSLINPVRNVRIVPVDRSDGESVLETSKHKVPIPIGEFKKLVPLLALQET